MYKQLSTLSFVADTIEDLQNIPRDRRTLGAECFVIENSKEYKCNSKGEWKVFSKSISIENGVNIGGGSVSNPNYYGGVDGNGCSCSQADWEEVDSSKQSYIRNKDLYSNKKVFSTQQLKITEPFMTITREELGWPEDFFNYSNGKSNYYDVNKYQDLLENWCNEKVLEYYYLGHYQDENERTVRYLGDGWDFENSKIFLMYYYEDEPENIYIKTNRRGYFNIDNVYKDSSNQLLRQEPEWFQSDWDDNDTNSQFYIKNKPFFHQGASDQYQDMIMVDSDEENIIKITLSLNEYNFSNMFSEWAKEYHYDYIKIIKTNQDGITQEFLYDINTSNDDPDNLLTDKYVKWIGDFPSIFGYDIDDINHFCLYYLPDEDINTLYFEGEAGTYEFYIYREEYIQKIDEKFLPDIQQTQSNWNETNENSSSYINNKPIYVDEEVLSQIELNIFSENGREQSFSRQDYNLGNFLIDNNQMYNIYLYNQNGELIYDERAMWQQNTVNKYNPETENDEYCTEIKGEGFTIYCWENDPDTIYYSGVRFGKFIFENIEIEQAFFPDPKYNELLQDNLQADWNMEYNTNYSYIKNKPFYEIYEQEFYMDIIDTSLGNQFSKEEYNLYHFLNPNSEDKNNLKIISKNGEMEYTFHMQISYEWLEYAGTNPGYNKYCVWYGDMPKEMGDLTNCGFSFYCYPDEDSNIIYYEGPEDIYTINYYKEGYVQKIDEKFLPSRPQSDWSATDPEVPGYIFNKPFYENHEYQTNWTHKDLEENQSFGRTEEFDWFLNPNGETHITINCYADVFGEWIKLPVQSIHYNAEDLYYYIGDVPSIANSGEENNYGFSFYVSPSNPDVIRYEGPTSYWSFNKHHPYELKQIDKKFIPTIALNDLLPEPVNTYELEGITLTLAETLNNLIAALENKYIIVE